MKKIIIFSCLALFLYAQDDYVPLSKLSNAKKIEYNFVDKKEKVEKPKIGEYEPRKVEVKKYEVITPLNIRKKEIKIGFKRFEKVLKELKGKNNG